MTTALEPTSRPGDILSYYFDNTRDLSVEMLNGWIAHHALTFDRLYISDSWIINNKGFAGLWHSYVAPLIKGGAIVVALRAGKTLEQVHAELLQTAALVTEDVDYVRDVSTLVESLGERVIRPWTFGELGLRYSEALNDAMPRALASADPSEHDLLAELWERAQVRADEDAAEHGTERVLRRSYFYLWDPKFNTADHERFLAVEGAVKEIVDPPYFLNFRSYLDVSAFGLPKELSGPAPKPPRDAQLTVYTNVRGVVTALLDPDETTLRALSNLSADDILTARNLKGRNAWLTGINTGVEGDWILGDAEASYVENLVSHLSACDAECGLRMGQLDKQRKVWRVIQVGTPIILGAVSWVAGGELPEGFLRYLPAALSSLGSAMLALKLQQSIKDVDQKRDRLRDHVQRALWRGSE